MAAVLKAYGIRVFCLDRPAIAPFIGFFASKFKCLLGLLVTGLDKDRSYSGVMMFSNKGRLISRETSIVIEKSMLEYIKT